MTMEALHSFVDDLVSGDSACSGFIGPLPNTSRFLGDGMYVSGGLSTDATLPIMVRCVYPKNTQSRHAVIHMKISMSQEALAAKLYEVFEIKETKGIITNCIVAYQSEESSQFAATGLPTPETNAENLLRGSHFGRVLELLGTTKCGILELVVVAEEQFILCPDCGHLLNADPATLERVREQCIDVKWRCFGCLSEIDHLSLLRNGQVDASQG